MNWHKITQYSNVYQICVGVCMSFMLSYADNLEENQASDNAIFSVRGGGANTTLKANQDSHYQLKKVTAFGKKNSDDKYQNTAGSINREMLDSNPSGNGDITSILRILPNVQYDNAQLRSTTPGEIDPANVSISGGLYYQNNFQLDGFNMNNDLNPAGDNPASITATGGRSQGLNIDTSLLESIKVQDSNISAAYGGFTGGVIEANTRRPTKTFGARVSYQITQGNATSGAFSLTNYHIYDENNQGLENFLNSTSQSNQPQFIKHIVRASLESKLSDKAGVIASFTTTQSFIPLNAYAGSQIDSTLDDKKKTQKRQSYNFFLKGYYDISENLRLESSYTYAPQYNNYFIVNVRDSAFDLQSGGHQATLKALWNNILGLLTAQSNFSYMENSRSGSANGQKFWRYSAEKNWNPSGNAGEGGYGNVDTIQQNLTLKVVQDFKELKLGFWENQFLAGADFSYVNAYYERKEDLMQGKLPSKQLDVGVTCTDTEWCSASPVPSLMWACGQWISQVFLYKAGKINLDNFVLGAFIEDAMRFDLHFLGELNTRFGIRLDSDTYMNKATFAPRFSLNYIVPWSKWSDLGAKLGTQLSFGANRYYGRNLFVYALMDGRSSLQYRLDRQSESTSWENATSTQYRNTTDFTQLNVPYADELMGGIAQKIFMFDLGAKYIHRFGRDEIMRGCFSPDGTIATACSAISQASQNVYRYVNTGRSETDVITLSIQNNIPIELWRVKNFFLFAFDWTNVKRNYVDYSDSMDNDMLANQFISYDGQLMRYIDRPADNFIRPHTIRLTTTHTFNIWRTKWLWNNFFRFRSAYRAMANTREADQDQFVIDGVLTSVPTFRAITITDAFSWDMRVGFEVDVFRGNTLFVNFDIYNVLDNQNMALLTLSGKFGTTNFSAVPTYEVGRQFWLEVGYKL
ncbi:TonB-dependent receptor plug domain-containing protein [uncultured Helicobacter sp.]|uniref:TonB-dependent receptor plug domain-containing protein n=1 Tax=uncultured Helicobacter sp. TaxID=175537 RepID=UPI002587C163|nr:TonB-dependent receptor plug domain-containing protein [uncultured Helicobacter sp.]